MFAARWAEDVYIATSIRRELQPSGVQSQRFFGRCYVNRWRAFDTTHCFRERERCCVRLHYSFTLRFLGLLVRLRLFVDLVGGMFDGSLFWVKCWLNIGRSHFFNYWHRFDSLPHFGVPFAGAGVRSELFDFMFKFHYFCLYFISFAYQI